MRALVVRAGALGDLLLLRPVVASLRRAGAAVTLLAPERPASALLGNGPEDAQRLVSWDGPAVPRLLAGDAPSGSLGGEHDVVLCYSQSPDLARGLAAVSARVIVHPPEPRGEHAADWLARPLARLGIPRVDPEIAQPTADEGARVREWLDRLPAGFLAIHPGSGAPRKNWPRARFFELARAVAPDQRWLLSLGPAEADATAEGAVVARDLPPRLLGALLSRAGLYVGNDSGVTHLAAAWGAPTAALFGPTDPAVWSPRGPRVRFFRAPDGSMSSLSVEDVVRGCREWNVVG